MSDYMCRFIKSSVRRTVKENIKGYANDRVYTKIRTYIYLTVQNNLESIIWETVSDNVLRHVQNIVLSNSIN